VIALPLRIAIAVLVFCAGIVAVALAADHGREGAPARGGATEAWGSLAPSPLRRTEVGAARVGRHIYVAAGFVPEGGATRRMVRYDIERDRWQPLRSMPIAVHHPGMAALKGKIYVHGGLRTGGATKRATSRLYRYNPATNRWRRLHDGRRRRLAHAFEPIAGKLYAAGGTNDSGDLRSVEVYSPGRDRWRRLRAMPTARNHVGAAALDGRLYVLGGRVDGDNLDLAERFDPSAGRRGRWRAVAPLQTERSGFVAVAVGGTIVAFGGEELGGGSTIAPVERYDPERDSWSRLPSMTTPRHGLGGAARAGRVYALEGGPQPGLAFSSANEYLDLP